jgi:hypothetical protein
LEFRTARQHHDQYWLVIVGNLRTRPLGKLHVDPCESLDFRRTVVQTPRTSWRSRVRVP